MTRDTAQLPGERPQAAEIRPQAQGIWGDVIAPTAQNILGGLGAGVMVAGLAYALQAAWAARTGQAWDPEAEALALWPLARFVWIMAWALAQTVRSFWDETVTGLRVWAGKRNERDAAEEIATIASLEAQIQELRGRLEEAATRSRPSNEMAGWATGRRILQEYYTNRDHPDPEIVKKYRASRDACEARGIRSIHWRIANDVMVQAGIKDAAGNIKPSTYAEAMERFIGQMEKSKRLVITKDGGLART